MMRRSSTVWRTGSSPDSAAHHGDAISSASTFGARWEIWVPGEMAYADKGAGARIGPNETLHFEIELISIE